MTQEEEMMKIWELLVECGICTDDEIGLAIALCGKSLQTLESVLHIRTGLRNLDQFLEEVLGGEI